MALPSGMGMMLKSLGINPDEIVGNINAIGSNISAIAQSLKNLDTRLTAIEKKLDSYTVTPVEAITAIAGENGHRK